MEPTPLSPGLHCWPPHQENHPCLGLRQPTWSTYHHEALSGPKPRLPPQGRVAWPCSRDTARSTQQSQRIVRTAHPGLPPPFLSYSHDSNLAPRPPARSKGRDDRECPSAPGTQQRSVRSSSHYHKAWSPAPTGQGRSTDSARDVLPQIPGGFATSWSHSRQPLGSSPSTTLGCPHPHPTGVQV